MQDIKKYSGEILTGLAALGVVIALGVVFWRLTYLVDHGEDSLPLLAIGGVVVLVLLLTAVTIMFSILNLTNKDQAMGLPEGSIRAVIALSLIVLFAILSVFLYQNVSKGGPILKLPEMTSEQRAEFIRTQVNARDIQSTPNAAKPDLYDVTYRSANPASEDFAKQLLVLLGTLMTAITSFYLGAGTVTSAMKAGTEASTSASGPTFTSIKPSTHSIDKDGTTLHLEAAGTNLAGISGVKLVKSGATPIDGTKVAISATNISFDFDVTNAARDTWSIEVSEGAKPTKTAGSLTITD